jgi:hypothetical protein
MGRTFRQRSVWRVSRAFCPPLPRRRLWSAGASGSHGPSRSAPSDSATVMTLSSTKSDNRALAAYAKNCAHMHMAANEACVHGRRCPVLRADASYWSTSRPRRLHASIMVSRRQRALRPWRQRWLRLRCYVRRTQGALRSACPAAQGPLHLCTCVAFACAHENAIRCRSRSRAARPAYAFNNRAPLRARSCGSTYDTLCIRDSWTQFHSDPESEEAEIGISIRSARAGGRFECGSRSISLRQRLLQPLANDATALQHLVALVGTRVVVRGA